MSAADRDEEFAAFLERRTLLPDNLDQVEPPAGIDERVLAQAREAIQAQHQHPSRPGEAGNGGESRGARSRSNEGHGVGARNEGGDLRPSRAVRWARPMALAATILLCFSIVLNIALNTKRPVANESRVPVASTGQSPELPPPPAAPSASAGAAVLPAPASNASGEGAARQSASPSAAAGNPSLHAPAGSATAGNSALQAPAASATTGNSALQAPAASAAAGGPAPQAPSPSTVAGTPAPRARSANTSSGDAPVQSPALARASADEARQSRTKLSSLTPTTQPTDSGSSSQTGVLTPESKAGNPNADAGAHSTASARLAKTDRPRSGEPSAGDASAAAAPPAVSMRSDTSAAGAPASKQVERPLEETHPLSALKSAEEATASGPRTEGELQSHPKDPKVWLRQIEALRAQGKTAQADAEMQRFRAALPTYPAKPAAPGTR